MNKIIGIGNALVDVLVRLDDDRTLDMFHLPKGSMQLLDNDRYHQIHQFFTTQKSYMTTGGSACNTMLALANLGEHTGIIGKVGDDALGEFFRRNSMEHGIDARLESCELPTGVASIFISPDGQRTFGTYLGAAGSMSVGELTPATLKGYTYLYIEGYLVQNHDLMIRACQLAREAGMTVCYDLASYNIVEADRDFITHVVDEYADIVFANEDEARVFTSRTGQEALDELARHCDVVVMKVGAAGAYIKRGSEQTHIPAKNVKVTDTNAAGDYFAAGFLYGYMRGCGLNTCGRIGTELSGAIIQVVGTALPTGVWDEIKLNIKAILSE